jgi:hypothetical protein
MFEEARRCRPKRLHDAIIATLCNAEQKHVTPEVARSILTSHIAVQEEAYRKLNENSQAIERGDVEAPKQVDQLLKACADADRPLKNVLHAMKTSALCLSGGGIRSASFALGILEGLARFGSDFLAKRGFLNELDYLSTVSGGGYTGSWLMAWVFRRWAAATGSACCRESYAEVVSALAGNTAVTSAVPEPPSVRHLRSYTSFLAPDLGLTLDTFTLIAILLRNLLVNWVMLLPVLFSVAAAVRVSGYSLISVRAFFGEGNLDLQLIICSVFVFAGLAASFGLPSHDLTDSSGKWRMVPVYTFLSAVLLGSWLLSAFGSSENGISLSECFRWERMHVLFYMALVLYGMIAVSVWLAYSKRINKLITKGAEVGFLRRREVVAILSGIAAIVMSYLISAALSILHGVVFPFLVAPRIQWQWFNVHVGREGLFVTLSVPLVIACLLSITSLLCAVLGLFEMEEDREWWVRAGGALLAFASMWTVAHALAFFGPPVYHSLRVAVVGMVTGLAASWLGFSSATSAGTGAVKTSQLSTFGKFLQKHNLVLPVIAGAAIVLIALGIVTLTDKLSYIVAGILNVNPYSTGGRLTAALLMLVVFVVLMLLANLSINVNVFSLHGMYRMRLMRAFLGASNVARKPDPFTQFDPRDTPLETDLPSQDGVPLHVICTTLNLVGTRNPAWRQRRAESFTFSPLFAGGWQVGYVPAGKYGGMSGVTLATALSVSGAAFNPNMGYQSSPLVGFLMTFFNLRLGYWLPNPKWCAMKPHRLQKTANFMGKPGPGFALGPLLQEALGQTNDSNRWIELTDGGHFDNLGLYEMVMRRCKLIIVSDAGADPKCQFEDLGNAIRKIQIDLGVPIVFPDGMKMKAGSDPSNKYCAVGRIEYRWTDNPGPGQKPEDLDGYLVYIKPALNGTEDMDVQQYANVHPTFPHEATANQFFDEPQFESYRKLGYHEVRTITKPPKVAARTVTARTSKPTTGTITDFFEHAKVYADGNPPSGPDIVTEKAGEIVLVVTTKPE